MGCRPSEVDEEDERDVELWTMWDNVQAAVTKRQRERAQREAAMRRKRR